MLFVTASVLAILAVGASVSLLGPLLLGHIQSTIEGKVIERLQNLQIQMRSQENARLARVEADAARKVREIRATHKISRERFQATITGGSSEELEQRVRQAHMAFVKYGPVLTVKVLLLPTGWLAIEWAQHPALCSPLRVICRKNGNIVAAETAFKGRYGDILCRGQRYLFRFETITASYFEQVEVQFNLAVPTEEDWQRRVAIIIDELAGRQLEINGRIRVLTMEEQLWQQARREAHKLIDASDADQREKQKRKATIDAEIQYAHEADRS